MHGGTRTAALGPHHSGRTTASTAVAVLAVVALVVGACGADTPTDGSAGGIEPRTLAAGSHPAVAVPTTRTPDATLDGRWDPNWLGSGEPVVFAFGGDVHFEADMVTMLDDPTVSMAPVAELLAPGDVRVVNLEAAITDAATPVAKQFTFKVPERSLDALASLGIHAVSLANNHGMDFGEQGLRDSLDARARAPLAVIGVGENDDDAYHPYLTEVRGQRIGVIAATQVLDTEFIPSWTATSDQAGLASAKEEGRLLAAVERWRPEVDTLVLYLHWGTERQTCPNPAQLSLAPRLVEAGADIVVGGHAHVLQGAGMLDGAFVAYGLGNFIWWNDLLPGAQTGALMVTATGRRIEGYQLVPARIRGWLPYQLTGAEAEADLAAFEALRGCTDLDP
ncbi:MAG: CapA family protein [Acidimicrobiia bacterium]|nr:CapA family protein [Acidimicrobiia bacterium]